MVRNQPQQQQQRGNNYYPPVVQRQIQGPLWQPGQRRRPVVPINPQVQQQLQRFANQGGLAGLPGAVRVETRWPQAQGFGFGPASQQQQGASRKNRKTRKNRKSHRKSTRKTSHRK